MILAFQSDLTARIRQTVAEAFGVTLGEILVQTTPKLELGDMALPLAFELANFDRHAKYMYEAANDVGPMCPMAYKVWDELAHHGQQLGVVRMGARTRCVTISVCVRAG